MTEKEIEIENISNEETSTEQSENTTSNASEESSTPENQEFEAENKQNQVDALQEQLTEEKNKYLRLYAEFENFRKRSAKERIDLIGTASSEIIKELLPIIDDFERALDANKKSDDIESVKDGFNLLHQKFDRLMKSKGVESIFPKDEMFDAEIHEAIAQMPASSDDQKGKIIDIVEKGYKINDKIIRHPKVVVAN